MCQPVLFPSTQPCGIHTVHSTFQQTERISGLDCISSHLLLFLGHLVHFICPFSDSSSSPLSHYNLKHCPGLYRITHTPEIFHRLLFTSTGLDYPQHTSVSWCSHPFRYFHLYRVFFLSKQRPGIGPRVLGVVTFLLHAHHLTTGSLICLNRLGKVGFRCSYPWV